MEENNVSCSKKNKDKAGIDLFIRPFLKTIIIARGIIAV